MGQISLIVSLVMIGLFAIAIIGFATQFSNDNNSPVSIAEDPEIMSLYTNTEGNISEFRSDSENTYASLLETTVTPGSDTPQSSKPFEITTTSALGSSKNILKVGYLKVFGTGSGFGIFTTAIFSVLSFMGIMYVIKTWRGNPD